jgi:hypothetical protein
MTRVDGSLMSAQTLTRGRNLAVTASALAILAATGFMIPTVLITGWISDESGGLYLRWRVAIGAGMLMGALLIFAAVLLLSQRAWWPLTLSCLAWVVLLVFVRVITAGDWSATVWDLITIVVLTVLVVFPLAAALLASTPLVRQWVHTRRDGRLHAG